MLMFAQHLHFFNSWNKLEKLHTTEMSVWHCTLTDTCNVITLLKLLDPKGLRMTSLPGLQICPQIQLRPYATLNFDLLHQSCCDTTGIYPNMCLRGLVKIRQIVLETSCRKRCLCVQPESALANWLIDWLEAQCFLLIRLSICSLSNLWTKYFENK